MDAAPPSTAPVVAPVIAADRRLLVAGIGELVLARHATASLAAYGLGSCIALAMWDSATCTAALAHFMLPSGVDAQPPVKFVDTGVPRVLAAFERAGGNPSTAELKAAGGASMLAAGTAGSEIGRQNAEALDAALAAHGLRLHARDVGGRHGRSVQLDAVTGRLLIRSTRSLSVL